MPAQTAEERYLDLLLKSLTRLIFDEPHYLPIALPAGTPRRAVLSPLQRGLNRAGLELVRKAPDETRQEGRDWPSGAETMIGMARLENVQACVTDVVQQKIAGDLIETGVWRGGATILMR